MPQKINKKNLSRNDVNANSNFKYTEGWQRHSHLGFCGKDADPLSDAL
jgi:hypothetical protein